MELKNDFEVRTGVEEAWRVLTDVERIAPAMPGAELREIEGDEYRGVVKVKVGPISAEYRGAARFVELDHEHHRAVLRAEGREARGQGNAAATITAVLEPSGKGTKVSVVTDLSITGKVAQFGRGVMADVSAKLLGQFVENLEATVIEHGDDENAAGAEPAGEEAQPARGSRGGRRRTTRPAAAAESEAPPAADEHETIDTTDPISTNGSGREHAPADEAPAAEPVGATVRKLEPVPAEPVDLVEVAGPSLVRRVVPVLAAAAVIAVLIALLRRLRS
jgi:carbon monoxide dehydrogenase subunit G